MAAGTTNMLIEPLSATSLTRKRVFTLGLLWLFQMIPAMSKELSQLPIQVGLGTCCPCELPTSSDPEENNKLCDATKLQVLEALKLGYRFIDTASHYNNEKSIAEAIDEAVASNVVKKDDVALCSKIWFDDMGYDKTKKAFELSCSNLKIDGSLAMILVHFPGSIDSLQSPAKNKKLRSETWQALEDLKMQGRVKLIGVSNYVRRHMKELLSSCRIKPDVIQIEIHPYFQQTELVSLCKQQGIQILASSPLAHGDRQLLQDPTLTQLSRKYNKSVPQVIIRWLIHENILPIVKSESRERLLENLQVTDFSLTEEDLQAIRNLDRDKRVGFDPNLIV